MRLLIHSSFPSSFGFIVDPDMNSETENLLNSPSNTNNNHNFTYYDYNYSRWLPSAEHLNFSIGLQGSPTTQSGIGSFNQLTLDPTGSCLIDNGAIDLIGVTHHSHHPHHTNHHHYHPHLTHFNSLTNSTASLVRSHLNGEDSKNVILPSPATTPTTPTTPTIAQEDNNQQSILTISSDITLTPLTGTSSDITVLSPLTGASYTDGNGNNITPNHVKAEQESSNGATVKSEESSSPSSTRSEERRVGKECQP